MIGERWHNVSFQQLDAVEMRTESAAQIGRCARLAADYEHRSKPLLYAPHTLRDGRWRNAECSGSPFETALPDDGTDSGKRGIIQHELSYA
ncbi:hypothetical protein Aam_021_078 [Acidocella aminolytica 101 = DSM 11237]|uniref:Uncharacterized protein n=1 Tax=Acidocella aminolytica 101 = DSM 11237 TaxID=1120923 RepID=A0A0D6PCK0_9PROT|nr:hypothetical protein Aam_021_078 [Acidocella aminolytica 101 = DSM 11237]